MTAAKFLVATSLFVALFFYASLRKPPQPYALGADRSLPNLLIISVETLRADHLGALGYGRPTTPNLDALARRGVIFSKAYAQSSWTGASLASLFTGTYPSTHRFESLRAIPAGLPTLPELFKARGYRGHGLTGWPHLSGRFGFGRGFDEYVDQDLTDSEIIARLKRLFKEADPRPILAFAHLAGPHSPYDPPPAYRKYDQYPEGRNIDMTLIREIMNKIMSKEQARLDENAKLAMAKQELKRFTPEDIAHNIALYDGEIEHTDALIGDLLGALSQEKAEEKTIVVVLGDHGEEFFEHGSVTHGMALYEESIRVPIIVAGPGVPRGRRVNARVQSMDLLPTLIALTAGAPQAGIQGQSLVPLMAKDIDSRRPVYSEIGAIHAVIDGSMKLIVDAALIEQELFDLGNDPGETRNLAQSDEYRPTRDRLFAQLRGFMNENVRIAGSRALEPPTAIPEQIGRRLEALGYSTPDARTESSEELLRQGRLLAGQGRFKEAVEYLRRAVELAPGYAPGHNNLGVALAQSGDLRGAAEQFEQALRLDPRMEGVSENLARARRMLSQPAPAQ